MAHDHRASKARAPAPFGRLIVRPQPLAALLLQLEAVVVGVAWADDRPVGPWLETPATSFPLPRGRDA
jgi:hypothetical protein